MHESQLLQLNSAKAHSQLSWATRWDFSQTMYHTIGWYRGLHDGRLAADLTSADIAAYLAS
jgi:dTDP-D-glucose 4,6-dehydratase